MRKSPGLWSESGRLRRLPPDLRSKVLTARSGRRVLAAVPGRVHVGWGVFAFLWPETVERLEAARVRMGEADRLVVAVLTGRALRPGLRGIGRRVPLYQRLALAAGLRYVDYVLVWREVDSGAWARRWGLSDVVWLGLLEPMDGLRDGSTSDAR